jgi:YVTN family beta-propeller protein
VAPNDAGDGFCSHARRRGRAYKAYVSNEKGNSISVIDTAMWKVVETIKVGQRPRGITFTKDQRYVLVAVGDDDTIVDTLPSGPDPELFIDDPTGKILYVTNENDNTVTIIDIERRARLGEVEVGVEPEGMGMSPDGKVLVNTSETTNMPHFIDTAGDCGQCAGRCPPALCPVQGRRLRIVGVVGDRGNGERHRSDQARGENEDRLFGSRHARRSEPACRH